MPQKLLIIREDDGNVKVGGPIQDRVLVYGMLEAAKDAIRDFHNQPQNLVQPADGPLVDEGR